MKTEQKQRTPQQLHKLISKYVRKWRDKLFLGLWKIDMRVVDHIEGSGRNDESWCVAATTDSNWKYLQADLQFSHYLLSEKEEKQIERIVIHELLHVLLNEMREEGIEHEERVISHLEISFENIEGIL